jgi:uncharacterized protein
MMPKDPARIQRLLDKSTMVFEAQGADEFVVSPCIAVCEMDEGTGLCQGCFRSLQEIAQWSRAPHSYKRQVWQNILLRLTQ